MGRGRGEPGPGLTSELRASTAAPHSAQTKRSSTSPPQPLCTIKVGGPPSAPSRPSGPPAHGQVPLPGGHHRPVRSRALCRRASRVARARTPRHRDQERRARGDGAGASSAAAARSWRQTSRIWSAGDPRRSSLEPARPPRADRGPARGDRRRRAHDRQPCRIRSASTIEGSGGSPNGLDIRRVRVPLGVVAVVYEARPNVTIDCSALCLKSGNAIVLRGSSTAAHSNSVLAQVAASAATAAGAPDGAISIVSGGDRDELREIATQDGVVDLIIPRGGDGLKAALKEHATVPVMYAAGGNCHVFVDASAESRRRRRDRGQLEGPAPLDLQRGRDAARARRHRGQSSCRERCESCARRESSCAWTAARARSRRSSPTRSPTPPTRTGRPSTTR